MTAPSPAAVERVRAAIEAELFHIQELGTGRGIITPERLTSAALAAYHAQLEAEGLMIRPRQPTIEMQNAGAHLARCKTCDGFGDDVHQNDIWRAMADAYEPPGGSE